MSTKQKATDLRGTSSKRARKVLTLVEKAAVIDAIDSGKSHHSVALEFNVGCTQVNMIIVNRNTIKAAYTEGMSTNLKYLAPRNILYPEIDDAVWQFFCDARSKQIPVNGPMLQSEANGCAFKYNNPNFSASNGWLKSFCDHHQIRFASLHGESAQVCPEAVEQWLSELPAKLKDYDLRDIYNCDEMSIFFNALPNKTLLGPSEKQEGLKVSKDRFSLLITVNVAGKKEKLLVIGKAKRPHRFPKYNSDLEHHVTYRSKKCGWMTTEIFTEYLNALNNKMR